MTSDAIGDINDAQGRELVDNDGQPLGTIREIFLDETTGQPAWAAVDSPGGGNDLVLAPLAHSTREGDAIRVAVTRERVETSPSTTGLAERFSPEHMDRVRAHYADRPAETATGAADYSAQRDTALTGELPDAMTRSEEELFVQRERVPRERVRLVKRIVTETITQTIEVRREELHLERVAISGAGDAGAYTGSGTAQTTGDVTTAAADTTSPEGVASPVGNTYAEGTGSAGRPAEHSSPAGGAGGLSALRARASSLVGKAGERFAGGHGFGEAFNPETIDLTLYEEQVVVSKRVVPRERVRIHREIVTEQQKISDELRKEQIEVQHLGLDSETRVEGSGYGPDAGR